MLLQQDISRQKNEELVGKTFKTLVEHFDQENDVYLGRTTRFAPDIDGHVIIKSKKPLNLHQFHKVEIS